MPAHRLFTDPPCLPQPEHARASRQGRQAGGLSADPGDNELQAACWSTLETRKRNRPSHLPLPAPRFRQAAYDVLSQPDKVRRGRKLRGSARHVLRQSPRPSSLRRTYFYFYFTSPQRQVYDATGVIQRGPAAEFSDAFAGGAFRDPWLGGLASSPAANTTHTASVAPSSAAHASAVAPAAAAGAGAGAPALGGGGGGLADSIIVRQRSGDQASHSAGFEVREASDAAASWREAPSRARLPPPTGRAPSLQPPPAAVQPRPPSARQAWLRSRGEAAGGAVLTAAGVAERFGVATGSYSPVPLERRDVLQARGGTAVAACCCCLLLLLAAAACCCCLLLLLAAAAAAVTRVGNGRVAPLAQGSAAPTPTPTTAATPACPQAVCTGPGGRLASTLSLRVAQLPAVLDWGEVHVAMR